MYFVKHSLETLVIAINPLDLRVSELLKIKLSGAVFSYTSHVYSLFALEPLTSIESILKKCTMKT
jgi:hypothetical protein